MTDPTIVNMTLYGGEGMNLNELKIAELKALYALIRERDAEIERLKERLKYYQKILLNPDMVDEAIEKACEVVK